MWAIESSKPCSTLNENKIGLRMKYDKVTISNASAHSKEMYLQRNYFNMNHKL